MSSSDVSLEREYIRGRRKGVGEGREEKGKGSERVRGERGTREGGGEGGSGE